MYTPNFMLRSDGRQLNAEHSSFSPISERKPLSDTHSSVSSLKAGCLIQV